MQKQVACFNLCGMTYICYKNKDPTYNFRQYYIQFLLDFKQASVNAQETLQIGC